MMENIRDRKKNVISLICVLVFWLIVFALDQIIKPTSKMYMLLTVLQKGSVYALAAVSMNLLNGFTGLFSLGHAGFMLIGAYTYAIFTIPSDARDTVYQYFDAAVRVSFPEVFSGAIGPLGTVLGVALAVILAGIMAAFFAYLIGLPVLRLKSDYLAIATLGFAEIIRAVFQWTRLGPVTNGSNLLKSFSRTSTFFIDAGSTRISFSTLVPIVIATLSIIVIVLLVNSSYGRAFKAIRDDEVSAEAMGINLAKHKMMSFVISSFFAGVAGATMAMVLSIAQASNFKSAMTYEILLMVVLGGIGSISGSVIGSFLFVASSEWWLRGLDSGKFLGINAPGVFRNGFRLVVFSVIIMIVVLFFRKGIMGDKEITYYLNKLKDKKKNKADDPGKEGA
ncbi:MAG: branched-chain amino acid ABC transporter permease [Oscillospiraceae bacterium]|nr:branched-chain amino acid ABC transporter permease [Oscillospiraceae bacterium]MBQ5489594.1 branched-chain amino acid ABC transporter permease [Oscillospiraceae bacterium]